MKKRTIWWVVPIAVMLLAGAGLVFADRDEHEYEREHESEHEEGFFSRWFKDESMAFKTEESALYLEECGGCHFPFQPGFLPADSWVKIMRGLEDHFGEYAELSEADNQRILDYLKANSAGEVNREISNKVMWSMRYTPETDRITETAFFRHEHREIPPRFLQNKGETISFSNCDSCHTRAMQGSYDDDEIRIPGVGRWDD
ncbi:MAG: diheme cytochrome c [Candidatus Thiodiazotropha sp. (ex Monitilora ramsayi)]|nr:diheme cytochrome c [Candidatus Thiodiazotropha sp. (ex Monitilora ramsayi)]